MSPTSLVRRMVERGRTTESSARRAYQRVTMVYDATADPTSAYPGEVPTLLKKAAELAGDHGAPVPVLAEALKIQPRAGARPTGGARSATCAAPGRQ